MSALTSLEVIPDVVAHFEPHATMQVTYGPSLKVSGGAVLPVPQTQHAPTVSWTAELGALYTLIMSDPDAPSRATPKFREWLHWIVGNIPGDDISQGEVLCPYMGPAPPRGTGLHRYVFLLYKQPGKLSMKKLANAGKFHAKAYADEHGLGQPIAVDFFQAENK